ncbi:PDE2 [[Candida] subhashii]|uniref:Phosphodiesterase n=1 Tax=[Candida] subhashii TaxID=561895 RepID=A0A8J5UQ97_9ASCO|nr:PDE2 [[Candida] subhashii]KAG7664621.1 PDE2 [[Candida] subhashii]
MVEVLSLVSHPSRIPNTKSRKFFQKFRDLVHYLIQKANAETDSNHPIVIIISQEDNRSTSSLDLLLFNEKLLLLRYYFGHLNLIVCNESVTSKHLEAPIEQVTHLITNRISRVETWTGTGPNPINDKYNTTTTVHNAHSHHDNHQNSNNIHPHNNSNSIGFVPPKVSGIIPTMTYILSNNCTKAGSTFNTLTHFKDLILDEINMIELLSNHDPSHLSQLCHAVGNWAFPAHELTNDDLVYCAYLMIHYALQQIDPNQYPGLKFLNKNELLGMIFMVRDTYKNGNPFHNFRHAVDVLQACFHFLVRLGCLPKFKYLTTDPEVEIEEQEPTDGSVEDLQTELVVAENINGSDDDKKEPCLNPLQTLGLLIAALGHDVGHPGVTNLFMIKNGAPVSLIFNDRSVLESYHSSVFINKILRVNWPSLLTTKTDEESGLTIRELIISSILATDMGEHFEYIHRLKNLTTHHDESINYSSKVKLIASLLIKCADISNVTRPLRVSAQWALVLAREFDEVALLDSKLNEGKEIDFNSEISYNHVAHDLNDILKINPCLHKGQIFFINTFAENLFNNIAELLPELRYTCDIIKENKEFWLARNN